ncbi:MAG TPA: adenylyl-sulfate kinase [Candidatus Saccharimonadales bacterium]|nr:adenylyl-sulfate kinase [Candidatus Saccharimonadales bacterium]
MKSFILAITGPAGSGKSTTASKLATQVKQCVNIDADVVKHMIVNGFIYGNEPGGVEQWRLLGTNIGMLAKKFHEAGYNVIINGYINELAWESIQQCITFSHKVLLLPHLDAVTKRDNGRHEGYRQGAEAVKEHHSYFSNASFYNDFVKIDSTSHTVDETIADIKRTLGIKEDV